MMPLLLDTQRESEMTGKGYLTTWMLLSLGQEMEKLIFLKVCYKSVKRFNVPSELNCTFPGDQYWRFSADKMPSGDYPKKINQGFPGIAERNLDAGMITNSLFHLFFF